MQPRLGSRFSQSEGQMAKVARAPPSERKSAASAAELPPPTTSASLRT